MSPDPGSPSQPASPPPERTVPIDDIEEPDYSIYRFAELRDIRSHLDATVYPERAARVEAEIQRRLASPGTYEPPLRDNLVWWRKHWHQVMGIVGILFGLLGAGGSAAGMVTLFNAPHGEQVQSTTADGSEEPAVEGGQTGDAAADTAGTDAAKQEDGGGSVEEAGDATAAADAEETTQEEAEGADVDEGSSAGEGSPKPTPPPRWYQAYSAGGRFAGVVIGAVLLLGAIQLLRRKPTSTFYLITAAVLAIGLNIVDQVMKAVALSSPTGQIVGVILVVSLISGLFIALVHWGNRDVLKA